MKACGSPTKRLKISSTPLALMAACALALAGCAQNIPYGDDPPPLPKVIVAHPEPLSLLAPPVEIIAPPPLPQREFAAPLAQRQVVLGKSVEGRPITMYVFGDGGDVTFIFAGIHGNEGAGVTLAQALLEQLSVEGVVLPGRTVAILPRTNPDGLAANRRANAHGVDLNRNFPAVNWERRPAGQYFGGLSAGSEPETRAVILAVEQLQPARIISIHSIDRGRQCNNYDGPAAALARVMGAQNGYPVKASIGYPTPGSFGAWAGTQRNVPTITLELPHGSSPQQFLPGNRSALLAAIEAGETLHVGR